MVPVAGLAFVAEIAYRYGGSVAADNMAGWGAALRMVLPKAEPPKARQLRASVMNPVVSARQLRSKESRGHMNQT